MKGQIGFTLIEVIIFIVVISIMMSAIFLALTTSLQKLPLIYNNTIATQTAKSCIEWFLGQRRLNGYAAFSCPSTTVPTFCAAPTGFTLSVNVACTTINSDANYKTITVTVSGKGNATLSTLVANY